MSTAVGGDELASARGGERRIGDERTGLRARNELALGVDRTVGEAFAQIAEPTLHGARRGARRVGGPITTKLPSAALAPSTIASASARIACDVVIERAVRLHPADARAMRTRDLASAARTAPRSIDGRELRGLDRHRAAAEAFAIRIRRMRAEAWPRATRAERRERASSTRVARVTAARDRQHIGQCPQLLGLVLVLARVEIQQHRLRDCSVGSGAVRTATVAVMVLLGAGRLACGTEPAAATTTIGTSRRIPRYRPSTQRPGDAAKGYDYLINGGYVTCGLPTSIAPVRRGAPDRLPGRTGDNATLPYYWSAANSTEGVASSRRTASCATPAASTASSSSASAPPIATSRRASCRCVDAAGGLISDPTENAEWMRFRDRIAAIADYSQHARPSASNPADSFTAVLIAHRDPATLAWSNDAAVAAAAADRRARRRAAVVAHEQEARDVLQRRAAAAITRAS